ncbi:MAG: flavin reductase family protein [Actinomycetota bacterium]|jgi:flavin reductase (DIM6/NTAB) family NADH-FMN oxidoreductase RutF|nr:flavin reductase family protein [Actinomycetota bacterium]
MKKQLGPQRRMYPMPAVLVVSGTGDRASMLTVVWVTLAGSKPPALALVVGRRHHTLELIRECGEFTVNIPSTAIATQVDYCGMVSGRDHDKVAESGLTFAPSNTVGPPVIQECPYNIECRLMQEIELPTGSLMLIGEIVDTQADESVLNADGTAADVALIDPIVYASGNREYWSMGEKIADAYSVGAELKRD